MMANLQDVSAPSGRLDELGLAVAAQITCKN
jgi:hypothetical protein